ncbi:MAG: CRISPR-associated protein Cse1 [Alphaproteobacteria bacterium]|nr:MAG: CRISPR-associated protein Cse1 [Alphaproteobacteria bacterium]
MARGEIDGFLALRPHQRAAWHMFLVQLATLAVESAGRQSLPEDADAWAEMLRALTPDWAGDEPWCLLVEEPAAPAFLQPPDPGGLKWNDVATPDALDILITSKNHDLKAHVIAEAQPDDWVMALVSLQTMAGYDGRGNYGIARMNGGSSSRPLLGLVTPPERQGSVHPSRWWRRDVQRLLALRREGWPGPCAIGGKALLWCEPWPEGNLLQVADLDPLFIEVARRVRMRRSDRGLFALTSTSQKARVNAAAFNGALGDAWAPVHRTENKSLTLGEGRFDYRRMKALLFDADWLRPPLAELAPNEKAGEMAVLAEALGRGNSKTYGLQSRLIPLPHSSGALFGVDAPAARLAAAILEDVDAAESALKSAAALYLARGDRAAIRKEHRQAAGASVSALDTRVDRVFFPALWRRLKAVEEGREYDEQQAFRRQLAEWAEAELEQVFAAFPVASILAPRARVRARSALRRALRKADFFETGGQGDAIVAAG